MKEKCKYGGLSVGALRYGGSIYSSDSNKMLCVYDTLGKEWSVCMALPVRSNKERTNSMDR